MPLPARTKRAGGGLTVRDPAATGPAPHLTSECSYLAGLVGKVRRWGCAAGSRAGRSTASSPAPTRWAGARRRSPPRSPRADRPHRDRRLGGPLGLPVLRGRLRPAGVRQGRRRSPRSRATRTARSRAAGSARRARRARAWSPARCGRRTVRYRRPYGTEWEELDLDTAMDMIADRVLAARDETWEDVDDAGPAAQPHPGHRQPRRGDAGQRGELPHQEAVHRAGRDPDREPGPYLTLRHRPRSGDQLRSRRRHRLPAGPGQR